MSETISTSESRTLILESADLEAATMLIWPTKAPAAVLDYTLDITPWLDDITDTLASFSAVVNSGNLNDLAIESQSITDGTGMTVVLAGGTTGNEYGVTLTATSAGGRIDAWTVWIYVQNIGATLARQQPTTIGPPGLTGPPGSTSTVVTLTQVVSGGMAVSSDGTPADYQNPFLLLGIATQGGLVGASIQVAFEGPLTETGWNWTVGEPVFLGAVGALTQVAPTTGYVQVVGYALTPHSIFVRLQLPIQL